MDTKLFTQDDKDFLIENGYLIIDVSKLAPLEFEEAKTTLIDFNKNKLYDTLVLQYDRLTSEETEYIKNNFPNTNFVENSYDKWIGPLNDLEGISDYIFRNGSVSTIPQIWFEGPIDRTLSLFLDLRLTISNELYEYARVPERKQRGVFTMFKQYGKISNHADAVVNSNRLCVITFYLNEKSEAEGNGGELILTSKNGDKIVIPPYMGTAVILDFAGNDGIIRNNLQHEVSEIKNNFRRYTYLSGIAL